MDEGLAVAVETATRTLWDMAIKERNLGALIFWLKCRGGFSIRQEVQVNVVPSGFAPTLDDHITEMAARQSALLDAVDADWVEVDDEPGDAVVIDPALAAMMQ
jgi:hypothetical protein